MKNMTRTAMAICFAALLALGAAACSDDGTTGPGGSEEANLSSDAGGSSDSGSSSEGASGEGSSETVSSSSLSSSSSWTFPQGGGRLLCTGWKFDFSGWQGTGAMYIDDSHYEDPASAQTVLLHDDGNYYPAAQGWTDSSDWTCPRGEPVEENGEMVSPCYWGWNDADMLTDNSVLAGVKLKAYVDPDGWGHVNGGFYYVNGTTFSDAQKWNVRESISVVFKGVAGMPVKIYLKDVKGDYPDSQGILKAGTTANGQWQVFTAPTSSFAPYNGATNVLNPAGVVGVGLEYELGATSSGAACTQCSDTPKDLEWQKLCFDQACEVGIESAKVASAKQVGFAALRNGLQFSNLGSSTLNVQIFNTLGKVVASSKVTAKNSFVSTEALGNGVYVVRATDGAKLNMMRNVTIMR